MADENTNDTPGQVPNAPTAPQQPPPNPNLVDPNATDKDGKRMWFDQDYVEGLRQEAANWRRRTREAEGQLDAARQPDTPAEPPAQPAEPQPDPRVAALEAQNRQQRIENAVLAAAARDTDAHTRFIDPADAVRLADLSGLEIGEDGTVSGVEEALTALASAKPHLLVQGTRRVPLSPTNPAGGATGESAVVQRIRQRFQPNSAETFVRGSIVEPPQE